MNAFIQIALAFGVASIACSQARLRVTAIVLCVASFSNAIIGLMQLMWSM